MLTLLAASASCKLAAAATDLLSPIGCSLCWGLSAGHKLAKVTHSTGSSRKLVKHCPDPSARACVFCDKHCCCHSLSWQLPAAAAAGGRPDSWAWQCAGNEHIQLQAPKRSPGSSWYLMISPETSVWLLGSGSCRGAIFLTTCTRCDMLLYM
jgi:hypothetical protein